MDHASGINRKDLGIVGTVIALVQLGVGLASSQNVSQEFKSAREEFNQMRLEREQFFVRKTEFEALSTKMDSLRSQLTEITVQVSSLKTFMKTRYGYSSVRSTRPELYLISGANQWNSPKKD